MQHNPLAFTVEREVVLRKKPNILLYTKNDLTNDSMLQSSYYSSLVMFKKMLCVMISNKLHKYEHLKNFYAYSKTKAMLLFPRL